MPLYLCKWPNSDVVFASAPSRSALNDLLDVADDSSAVVVKRFKGRFALEFKHKLPGGHANSADRLKPKSNECWQQQLGQRMWQLRGSFCDLVLSAENGATEVAHKVVLAAVSKWFSEHVREDTNNINLPAVKTQADLQCLLRFLYLRELQPDFDVDGVYKWAQEYDLPGLSAAADHALAVQLELSDRRCRIVASQSNKDVAQLLLRALVVAQRYHRPQLFKLCVHYLEPQLLVCLQDMAEFSVLPCQIQQHIVCLAYRRPPCVSRKVGGQHFAVPVDSYKAAGGSLTTQEQEQMAAWEKLVCCSDWSGAPWPAVDDSSWDISHQELEESTVKQEGAVEYELVATAPYHEFYTFKSKLTRFAFPRTHVSSELDHPVSLLRSAIVRDLEENWKGGRLGAEETARLVVTAEQGNMEAAAKLALGTRTTFDGMSDCGDDSDESDEDDDDNVTDIASLDAILRERLLNGGSTTSGQQGGT